MASELSKIVLKKDDLTEVQVYLHGKDSRCYMCDVEITSVYYKKYGFVNESSKQKIIYNLLSFQLKCSSNIDSLHYLRLTNSFHQVPRDIHTLPVKEPIPSI